MKNFIGNITFWAFVSLSIGLIIISAIHFKYQPKNDEEFWLNDPVLMEEAKRDQENHMKWYLEKGCYEQKFSVR